MTMSLTRRAALKAGAGGALATLVCRPFAALADDSVETHGLSSFGDLALPPDFPHFSYVNPNAPTGGLLSLQITGTSGNQNFDTFDTLNIYSWKGNGAAGMSATFDTLMTANGDEPDSVYGLLAQSVRVSADKLDYRFRLRPEARFVRRLESDSGRCRLFAQRAEGQGPPDLRPAPEGGGIGERGRRRRRARALRPGPQPRRASDRRRHAGFFGRVVEGARFYRGDARCAARFRPL